MPDILYVTLEGYGLDLEECVSIDASVDFDAPEDFSNFVLSDITAEGAVSYPEGSSNFVYLPLAADVDDSHTLGEVLHVRILSVPLMFMLSAKENVSFLAHQGFTDIAYSKIYAGLLFDISSNADIFEYSDAVTRLFFRSLVRYSLASSLALESSASFVALAFDAFTSGLSLSDTIGLTGSASIDLRLRELLKVLFDVSLSFNLLASYEDYLKLVNVCDSLFRSADLSTIELSANALLDSILYTAVLLREELTAAITSASVLNTTVTNVYGIEALFIPSSIANFVNTIHLLTDIDVQLFVPRLSTLTTAWYVFPKAISMHTLSPESVCEWNDTVYMAFDDGIYVFDDTSVSNTGLVFDFGDLSSPVFKRLGDMFISGTFDSLTVAVDMDDVRNTYVSDINKIKFAKGHKGYNIKLFIEGLLQLDALDMLIISLSKRRRFG